MGEPAIIIKSEENPPKKTLGDIEQNSQKDSKIH